MRVGPVAVRVPGAPCLCLLLLAEPAAALPTHVCCALPWKASVGWQQPTGSTMGMPHTQLQGGRHPWAWALLGRQVEELLGAAACHAPERSLATLPAQRPQRKEGVAGQGPSPSWVGGGREDTQRLAPAAGLPPGSIPPRARKPPVCTAAHPAL